MNGSLKTIALVAARSGSERVSNKNVRPFGQTTLLENKLSQLLRIDAFDSVVLSSDSPSMIALGIEMGCQVHLRAPNFASSDAAMSEVYVHLAEACDADVIVYANCTSPLIRDRTILKMVAEYQKESVLTGRNDSVNTVTPIRQFLWRDGRPLNYDPQHQPRSQDLAGVVAINFAISVIARDTMIKRMNVVGERPHLVEVPAIEGTDIDTAEDFDFAERQFAIRGGDEYLRS